MSESRELLATLRDIAEPPAPVGSPPLLIAANVALALLIAWVLARRIRRHRRAWLTESLAGIERARHLPPAASRLALAGILRRVMRHRHGRACDELHGEPWLVRLDEEFGGDWFTRGDGRAFGDALYAPPDPMTGAPGVPDTPGASTDVPGGTAAVREGGSAERMTNEARDTARLGEALARRLKRLPRATTARVRATSAPSGTASAAHGTVAAEPSRP